ncbi:SusC/RagA family TonB-linked outer membrane protein [Flavobacterium tibetense]|jgi:TonB-dependent starch-binding outer membrane protein SusC|uniref:SusC/RagA family TonB-linked outer membrane protein n=1 Tax=Flavobacterium tibetense TaxID=2233533 RepID=A0A365P4B7_9FLAO|nr:SusC/RagA family TonB-linked outer membrane protein [Flavobacterium tibetense]RBA29399.1 SusC/RagA family TonB-linked outer membrane protein [Flavobacterium tibetense]
MRSKFKWIFTLLVAFTMQFSFAQQKTVTGVVSDKQGPLAGANVVVQGTTNGTTTDFDGNYSIQAKQGDVLEITYTGMRKMTVKVGASNVVNAIMEEDILTGSEVVVQGFRTVTKQTAVTSIAKVDSKTIENRPNANVMNTLQGQLAGVNITTGTGQPGAKSSVIIRGIGSFNASSDPLYVIDGFPSNSDNFRSINPNDIESVQVLKDAAATSEYGSRGTNGVIIIKTKTGSFGEDKTTFRYSTQHGITELQTPKYNYASSKQLLRIEREYGTGMGVGMTDAEIDAFGVNTDWVDYFFRTGVSTAHNLSVEKNAKNMNSFTSVSYFNQEGVLNTTNLKRFTVRNNLNGKSTNGKFNYSMNIGLGFSKNNEATNAGEGAVNRNYLLGAYISAPYLDPNRYEGSVWTLDEFFNTPGLLSTPYMLIDKLNTYVNETQETRFNVATEASYKITKELTGRIRTSAEFLTNRFNQAEFPDSFNALLFSNTPGVPSFDGGAFNGFEDINQRREFLLNNLYQLDYKKTIGKHTFGLAANTEYNFSTFTQQNMRQRGLNPQTFVPNTGVGYLVDTGANDWYVPQISANRRRVDYISYFGSFDYDFDEKYGFVASLRRDKVSYFADDKQAESFWSVGGRWNLDKESFMDNATFIDVLKLRGSYGTVGNARIVGGTIYAPISPNALYLDNYNVANNVYNGQLGYGIGFGFPSLKWELTKQWNAGLDFEMFKGRLRGTYDYYNRETVDMFLGQPVSNSSGTSQLNINSDASLTNFGHEIQLAYDLIRNPEKGVLLTVRANGAHNTNRVDGIISNNGRIQHGTVNVSDNGGMYFEYYTIPYVGVNETNGELLFLDINGNVTENVTSADQRKTGKNFLPTWQGGFGFDFEYKGFFTSSTFTFVTDVWRFDTDLDVLNDPTNLGQFTVTSDLLNAWTPTNTNTNVPSLTASNLGSQVLSDRFLKDASYVRLRNLQIGYRIPKKFLANTFISDLSLTLQGENLWTWTKWQGFDAESNRIEDVYQYPSPRQYTFGLDIKF